MRVIDPVPAGVFQKGERYSREHTVLRIRSRHGLVLKHALLPMSQLGADLALVLQLSSFERRAIKVPPHLPRHSGRHHQRHLALYFALAYLPVLARKLPDYIRTRLIHAGLRVERRLAGSLVPLGQRLATRVHKKGVQTRRKAQGVQDLVLQSGQRTVDIALL